MEEQNTNNTNPFGENKLAEKPKSNFSIVGYNVLVLVAYTLFSRLFRDGGFVIDAFLIVIHVFTCIVLALTNKSWMWVLSAILVLIIGFSTCVYGGMIG